MDPKFWKKGQTRFVDGLGYDWYRKEQLIMEESCGQHKEKVSKIVDGSIKQIRSMIAMLKCMANSHRNVSFATTLKTKVFGLNWSLYSDTIGHVHLALCNRDIATHLYKAFI
ncbi:hypothetical protein G6F49_010738 [Rhizopus delemar]|nr:hypothetical protein G6F49_010738 [Rhizopus delemar]KAG1583409.1 hypothetical protein G6F48_008534 [Rhizopus delemar]